VFWAGLLLALVTSAYISGTGRNPRPIASDGWGYYLYLPAVFVYDDLNLGFLKNKDLPRPLAQYRLSDERWQGLLPTQAGYRNRYAAGVAVLQLPFFLVALAFAKLTLPTFTGFELPFQLASVFSAGFYFALGCYFTYHAARSRYGRTPSLLALGFMIGATNVLAYASFEPSFSHIYGFFLVAALLDLTVRRSDAHEPAPLSAFALFGLLTGLAAMVRPTNVLVAALYLLFVARTGRDRIVRGTLLCLGTAFVAVLPQLLIWLATAGQLVYYSYGNIGFNFLQPVLIRYLFGTEKGVFFWHPAYLVAILALVGALTVRFREAALLLAIVGANIYIGASWFDPSFGDSFGCRQIIEMIPLLTLPVANTLAALQGTYWRAAAGLIGALLISINALQFHGYINGSIPHNHTTWRQYRAFWTERVCRVCLLTVFGAPALPTGRVVDFSTSGDGHVYFLAGWSEPEDWGTWSDGTHASLAFRQTNPSEGTKLRLLAAGFERAAAQPQSVTVRIDGHSVGLVELAAAPQWIEFDVPGRGLDHRVDFEIATPTSPADRGLSADPRRLGIALHNMTLLDRTAGNGPALQFGQAVDFSVSGKGAGMISAGWSQPEDWGTWSDSAQAFLLFRLPRNSGEVKFRLRAIGFEPAAGQPQRVAALVDGHPVAAMKLGPAPQDIDLDLPASALAGSVGQHVLEFDVAEPARPIDRGLGDDARRLGIGIESLTLLDGNAH
jgi:hypothetical protein